jgi:hypothetical protein
MIPRVDGTARITSVTRWFGKVLGTGALAIAALGALVSALSLLVFLASMCVVLFAFDREPRLEYMFEDDDPVANVAVSFPLEELALRLDASGHRHGSAWLRRPDGVAFEASLDNRCTRAWFRPHYIDAMPALHVVGLEANRECKPGSSRESLLQVFKESFVPRLEGTLSPLDAPPASASFYDYPIGSEPSLLIAGSIEDARHRLDGNQFFDHAVHDGVFYLHEGACSGRFRLVDEPQLDAVRVVGVGYEKPCSWGSSDACLERVFRIFLMRSGDPTTTPTPTLAPGRSTPTPCPPLGASGDD